MSDLISEDTPFPSSHIAETVTPGERRRALEGLAFDADPSKRTLDPLILGTLGLAATDPMGERFEGEGSELALMVAQQLSEHAFETRLLAQAAIEVWSAGTEGTAASRTALLRATGAFLLHDKATWMAVAARDEDDTLEARAPDTD